MKLPLAILALLAITNNVLGQEQPHNNATPLAKADTVALKEIVVNSTRPVSRIEADGIVTTIQGTILQGLGTARDVLGFLPYVISDGDKIEVFGKGEPVIYINNRRVYNMVEIDQLTSSKIKSVTVVPNPGAKYSSDVNAVIRITTVKEQGVGLAFNNQAIVGQRNYAYLKDILSMNYRSGGLDLFTTLEYDNRKNRGRNLGRHELMTKDKLYHTTLNIDTKNRFKLYDGKLGFNYVPSEMHSLGMFYQLSHSPLHTDFSNRYESGIDGILLSNSENNQELRDSKTSHLIDAYYSGKWGAFTSNITFDILWRNNKSNQTVSEHLQEDMYTHDRNNGRMVAAKADLSKAFWKGTINFGAEYTGSQRKDVFICENEIIANSDNRLVENHIGAYVETNQMVGRAQLMLGVRYEHMASSYFEDGKKQDEQSPRYNEVMPSANITIPFGRSAVQIGYARKFTRPLYSQLSSTVTYVNPTFFETGNPHLKTTFYDNFYINVKWKSLMIMSSYQHVSHPIIDTAVPYRDNPEIILLSKANSEKALHNIQFMAQYEAGMIGKYYYPVLAAGIVSQIFELEYRNASMKLNSPMGIIKWMNIFMLPGGYRFNANLSWRSAGDSHNAHIGKTWQMDISASKTYGLHWDVKISANDIFNTAATREFTIYSNNSLVSMRKHSTMRNIELNITYRFNVTPSKYLGKGAGNSERERLVEKSEIK